MSETVIVISLALAIINIVGVWVIGEEWFEENVNNIIKICLILFDLVTIITVSKLI